MQKHSKPLKYSISSLHSVNYVWLSWISKGIVPPFLPLCITLRAPLILILLLCSTSHHLWPCEAKLQISLQSLLVMTDMILVEASVYFEGAHDYLLPALIIIIIRQHSFMPQSHLHLSCRCGGSQYILIYPKQATL